MSLNTKLFIVLLVIVNIFIVHTNALEVFVDAVNGNDNNSNPGPFKTLQRALVSNANSIWMKSNGVHNLGNATIYASTAASLRIFSNGTSQAELRCLSSPSASFYFEQINSLTFDNLLFGNCTTGYAGIQLNNIKNIQIINTVIEGFYVPLGASALSITSSNATITGTIIRNNFGGSSGGGIYIQTSNVTIDSSQVTQNFAAADGGGLCLSPFGTTPNSILTLKITNSIFSFNHANSNGGAVSISGSNTNVNVLLSNVTVASNTAGQVGGGLCLIDVAATVQNCEIYSNILDNTVGGGVFAQYYANEHQIYQFLNTHIHNNVGDGGAGLRFDLNQDNSLILSPSIVDNCKIYGNSAPNYGAGVSTYYFPVKISNTEISGNDATNGGGGGLHFDTSDLELLKVTITDNSGWGISCYNSNINVQDPSINMNTPGDTNPTECQYCNWNSSIFDCENDCIDRDSCSVCSGNNDCLGCNDVPYAAPCPSTSAFPSASSSPSQEDSSSGSKSKSNSTPIIAGAVGGIGGFLVLASAAGAFVVLRKKRAANYQQDAEELRPPRDNGGNTQPAPSSHYSVALASSRSPSESKESSTAYGSIVEEFQMPAQSGVKNMDIEEIVEGEELGRGSFGVVFKGTYKGKVVAVKKLLDSLNKSQLSTFSSEAAIMASIPNHKHVVELIGMVTKPPCIVVKFYANGSLQKLLRETGTPISKPTTVKIIRGITEGMAHLARHKVVHRDLAARNILLDENWNAIVSDFGFARALQEDIDSGQTYTTVGPIRWMALESLTSRMYSEKSDVWSWAVTVWECLTRATPFAELDNVNVIMAVTGGRRLSVPTRSSPQLATLLTSCWNADATQRPTFDAVLEVVASLGNDIVTE